jgi:4-hydroxy 2-oxovalerate aldolase
MSAARPLLLDCTLRDGGYQTGWRFSDGFVADWLAVCAGLGVDRVELGYLRVAGPAHPEAAGDWADLPRSLTPGQRALLAEAPAVSAAVMVDAADAARLPAEEAADRVAQRLAEAPIAIPTVRVATRMDGLSGAAAFATALAARGITPIVNLMQAADLPPERLAAELPEQIGDAPIEALYFADSFGRMRPTDVERLFATVAAALPIPLGFHAHDNSGLAVANTQAAIEAGARTVDATMGGLGRGAGNAATETVRLLLDPAPTADALAACDRFLARHVEPLRAESRWGATPLYRWQARVGLHPTYAQKLAEDAAMTDLDRFAVLDRLAASSPRGRYDAGLLETARRAS